MSPPLSSSLKRERPAALEPSKESNKKKKRLDKTNVVEAAAPSPASSQTPAVVETTEVKSRKQRRLERKALEKAKKAAQEAPVLSKEEAERAEKQRLRKERRQEVLLERARLQEKQLRKERKLRQEKKRNRLLNSNPTAFKEAKGASTEDDTTDAASKTRKPKAPKNDDTETSSTAQRDLDILKSLLSGSRDETTGMTTLASGVQYKDTKIGKEGGPTVQNKMLVTVQYQLRALKSATVLDSSKKFTFRVGKGEVIRGWDIGVVGMRPGGSRHLIVPPKAGYGSQDIGGGPGATLCFDITVLSIGS